MDNAQSDNPVTKEEALATITGFIDKPGILDLTEFMELLKWQTKLTLWLLKEYAAKSK